MLSPLSIVGSIAALGEGVYSQQSRFILRVESRALVSNVGPNARSGTSSRQHRRLNLRLCIMFNLVGTFKAFTCQDGAGDVGSCSGSDPAISLSIASTYIVYAFTYRLVALHPGWA